MPPEDCLSRDQLQGFALATLDPEAADVVAEHLDTCDQCAAAADELTRQRDDPLLRGLRHRSAPSPHEEEPQCAAALEQAESLVVDLVKSEAASALPRQDVPKFVGVYEILRQLGEGGMGTVYLARHPHLDRLVALKILPERRLKDEASIERFQREMRAVGRLAHPNIVMAHDAGQAEGVHFLVMEYIEGWDLSWLVRRLGALAVPDACELVRQTALGLQYAHENGLVHRDIKPSNLMLARDGQVKILDMGLALLGDAPAAGHELTASGQVMGTLDYMAPEQGASSRDVDTRADIYSLGATLYKLLTGSTPFDEKQYDTPLKKLAAMLSAEIPPIREVSPGVPDELSAIVHRMLDKQPEHRQTTPGEVAEALEPFAQEADLQGLVGQASAVSVGQQAGTPENLTLQAQKWLAGLFAPVEDASANTGALAASGSVDTSSGQVSRRAGTMPRAERASAAPRGVTQAAGFWWKSRGFVTAVAAALIAIMLLSAILTIATKKGTIVVEGPDGEPLPDDVTVVLSNGGDEIEIHAKDQWTVRAAPDEFQVAVRDSQDRFVFEGETLTVQRFGRTVLNVTLKPTAMGAAATTDSRPNYALEFNGMGNYVKVPSFRFDRDHPITVEACVNLKGEQGSDIVRADSVGGFYLVAAHPNVVEFGKNTQKLDESSGEREVHWTKTRNTRLVRNRTVHIAATWDGKRCVLFLNGSAAGKLGHGGGVSSDNDWPDFLLFGTRTTEASERHPYPRWLNGTIDEVRISNVVRYTKDFEPHKPHERFEPDKHTLALYHFDEGEGEVARDSSGNKHDGKIVGAKWVRVRSEREIAEWIRQLGGNVGTVQGNINQISLHGNRKINNQDLQRFRNLSRVTIIALGNTNIGDDGIAYLSSLMTLKRLDIYGTRITDSGLRHLAGLKNLNLLHLRGTAITDQGLTHLTGLQNLETLILDKTKVTDAGVEDLAKLSKLKMLDVSGTGITAEGAARLHRALPGCKVIYGTIDNKESFAPAAAAASPFDALRREDIDPYELSVAGDGDPDNAPAELVAIYGDSRLRHWGNISQLAYSADGRYLFSYGDDRVARVWDPTTGRQLRAWAFHWGGDRPVAFAERANVLMFADTTGVIDRWDVETGEKLKSIETNIHLKNLTLSVSADATVAAIGSTRTPQVSLSHWPTIMPSRKNLTDNWSA